MNTYHIQYFGLLAERRGLAHETIRHQAKTLAALYRHITDEHPFGISENYLRATVNDGLVSWDHALENNDRIAFLPPMSGG